MEIDIPTDDVMTTSTSATNDAWKAITETGMNEIIPGVGPEKGRQASREPELQTQSKERSVGRQPEITTKGQVQTPREQHRKTEKRKKPAG